MSTTTATTAEMVNRRPHVLVFPYPAQGHSLVMLDLAHQLALRDMSITILVTPKNLPMLDPLLASHRGNIQPLVLPFPPHRDFPPGFENLRDVGISRNMALVNAMSNLHDPILRWFRSHPNPPLAILSDIFLGWTQWLAEQLRVRRVCVSPNRVAVATVFDHCFRNAVNKDDVVFGSVVDFHGLLPNSPSFRMDHLPNIFRNYDASDPDWRNVRDILVANASSWAFVFNTFEALEGEFLDHFRAKMGHSRVYGVGPLNLLTVPGTSERGKFGGGVDDDVMEWLEGCEDESVLYICFGSQKFLKRRQTEALAAALELSESRFVWVVKTTGGQNDDVVPEGLEERVRGRGLVVRGWAPQLMILNHRAVWGLLSYCGWNSVLEGISAGVALLIWPMEADHFINAKLLEEEMGLAVKVCEGDDAVPDPVELGKVVDELLRDPDGPRRARVRELRDGAFEAVRDGGTSRMDLDELAKQLRLHLV